jgi:hypothetical protein
MRPIPRERTGQPAGTRLSFVAENPSNRDGRRQNSPRGSGAIRAVSFTRGVRLEALPALAPAGRRATAFDLLPVIEKAGRRQPELRNAPERERAPLSAFSFGILRIITEQDGHLRRAPDPAQLRLEPSPYASHRATVAREGRPAPPCLEKLPRSATAADLTGPASAGFRVYARRVPTALDNGRRSPQEAPTGRSCSVLGRKP